MRIEKTDQTGHICPSWSESSLGAQVILLVFIMLQLNYSNDLPL